MTVSHLIWPARILLILLVWVVFGILWWAPLIFMEALKPFGSDLPTPALWAIQVAHSGAPLACGLLYSVILAWQGFRPGRHDAWGIVFMLAAAALWVAVTLAALSLPLLMCGFHWPALPWADAASNAAEGCRLPD